MKNKDYRLQALNSRLREMKKKGVTQVTRKLNYYQFEFLKSRYSIVPAIWKVRTKQFIAYNFRDLPKICKRIHNANKKGKKYIYVFLSPSDLDALRIYGVRPSVLKYRITLN